MEQHVFVEISFMPNTMLIMCCLLREGEVVVCRLGG